MFERSPSRIFIALAAVWVMIPVGSARAQLLSPGDLAIVGMNMTDPNEFSFVALVDIPAGTEIRFTDNGWTSQGVFREEEDTMIYTAPVDLNRGTVVVINGTVGPVPGLATAGDQLFAYQVTSNGSIRFIYGINNTPGDGWQEDAVTDNDTTLPTQLINAFTAVSLPHCRNVVYTGVAIGRQAELLLLIGNPSGWICQNAHHLNLALPPFTVTGVLNNIPTFSSALPDTTIRAGELLEFRYEAEDLDGQTLLFNAPQLPSGAVIAPTSGVLRWIPAAAQIGSHVLRIGVSDGISTTYVSATVTVTGSVWVQDDVPKTASDGIRVWPNPVSSWLNVDINTRPSAHRGRLRVHDTLGRLHFESTITDRHSRLNVSSWPAGVYMVSVQSIDGLPYFTTVVVEK